MQFGAMTNPYKELLPQIHWIGTHGFDYVEIAVEPPKAEHTKIDSGEIQRTIATYNLEVVIHTSPYLPVASAHPAVRAAAQAELLGVLALADKLGSPLLTIHYLGFPKFYSFKEAIDTYVHLLKVLTHAAKGTGIEIAIENSPANRKEIKLFREIFQRVPDARLLLDIGHTNIHVIGNLAKDFLEDAILGDRISHVHVSDNDGQDDLHLPLGSVRNGVDWQEIIGVLQEHFYKGRITFEVFSPDLDYLLISRDKFKARWAESLIK